MKAAILIGLLLTGGIACAADAPKAPEPARPVEAASFYAGRWYEIGRTPKSFSDGCVAGTTDFLARDGALTERDACHDKTPDGKEEVLTGSVKILNPGQNTKLNATYRIFLGIAVNREVWVLDHAEGWAIFADADMKAINLYSREPHPAPALVEKMTKEIRDLGYGGALEFPTQSRP